MSVNPSPIGGFAAQFFDNNGQPLSGGKIYTYAAGTTTPQATYTSALGITPHANPIVLDSAGRVPGGEIWLTDGLIYKFVIETSLAVLIGTYDNITGVNSNFVNYTVQEEVITATAGQTVFNLSTINYTPGTNSLSVYIDGVNQYVGDSYLETDSNTVTFTSGLHVGAEVKFTTAVQTTTGAVDANDVGYTAGYTGATGQTVQTKLEQYVSVKDFGAVGDGVADDTTAVHAAITEALSVNGSVFFPAGKYRVTSGYTNNTNNSVTLFGESIDYFANDATDADGSCVILDSTNPSSFFYSQTAGNNLLVQNMQFTCAQMVADRAFFKQSAVSVRHIFENVHFASVERPFVYYTGCYFQLSSYTNVRFTNSGTFHSVSSSLTGTFMLIDNVDVEGFIALNSISEKVICNLQNIREIQARNFIIEPGVPDSGWTGLSLSNAYDADWTRFPNATFRGFWMEVTGSALTYTVYQTRGRVKFIAPVFNNIYVSPYRIDDMGAVEISDTSFSGTSAQVQSLFNLNTQLCQVKLTNCNYRNADTAITNPRFTFDNCSWSPSGGVNTLTATSHNNQQSELLWAFDGGYPDPGKVSAVASGGTTIVPSVDATFGRGLYVNPSAGSLQASFQGFTRNDFAQGGQMFVVVRGTLPNIPSGSLELSFVIDGSAVATAKTWTSSDSNADFRLVLPFTATAANPTNMGVAFNGSADTGPLKLYQLELWIGKSLPSVTMPSFPQNVQTYAASTPAAGEWARGDIIWNNTPSAGGAPGWVCTAGGTPGTWKAMANLAP